MSDAPQHSGSNLRHVLARLNRNRHFETFDDVALFRIMSEPAALQASDLIEHARGQLRQDLFAAALTGFKTSGYFVEIGATDGLYLSNTHLLEQQLGWNGILAEPARYWHETLHRARKAHIDTRCVHPDSNRQVMFREVTADQALSTVTEFAQADLHGTTRETGEDYPVETISLADLLSVHNAPRTIDFLSIDTEGSEFAILERFDFSSWQFGAIVCEHNYTPNRNAILDLLSANGYTRVLNHITLFDDWYVHADQLPALTASFPDWRAYSDQNPSDGEPELTGNERMIRMLKETVENLILDRNAHKSALEEMIAAQKPAKN